MKNLYFLPQWCIEKGKTKKNKSLKLLILIILIVNIIFLDILMINRNQLNDVETRLKEHNSVKKLSHDKSSTFENYLDFYNYIYLGRNFKNVNIENKSLDLDIEGDEKECFSVIKDAEKSNKFIIKSFKLMENDEGGKKLWKVNLKLK
jgi:hypothetical protein